jgi:pyrroloquinoline quinone biosynthesis protein E
MSERTQNGAMLQSPLSLLAELTYRCPLGCPYCSNPLDLEKPEVELDSSTWARVFGEAAELGVRHVDLSGGEPGARRDLVDIAAHAREAGLCSNLVTSGVGITTRTLRDLWEAGLDRIQVSFQDADAVSSDRISGQRGAFQRKHALAAEAVRLGLPLTVNLVVHRANIGRLSDLVDLALGLKAVRVAIVHVQYSGWALKNRPALMPTAEQVRHAAEEVEALRSRHRARIAIDAVVPDDQARCPEPCAGGWGRRLLHVTPFGRVLPCHAAETIPGLEFWNVRDHALGDIWMKSPAFNTFRGTDFLREPCLSCERREIDFRGCRCRAYRLTGDARATDPVCELSPHHARVAALSAVQEDMGYAYRRM